MPFIPAVIAGVGSIIGGAAAGVAGLAGAAASAVGSVASGILGGAASAVGALAGGGGGQAAVPVMVGGEMGSLSAASSLGVPVATTGVATGLSTITSAVTAGVGIYGQLADIEIAKGMTEAEKIKQQAALMEAEALKLYAAQPGLAPAPAPAPSTAAIPTLSAQPVYVTPSAAPAPAPNYLLYAGLAILAFLVLGKIKR